MSFSDNLENNLKSLEAQEERDPQAVLRQRERANEERQAKVAAGPYAQQLRTSEYTQALLAQATRLGFMKRTKVHIAWIDTTLRLEAKNLRLELRPTPKGISAHFLADGAETQQQMVDLSGDAAVLAQDWLSRLETASPAHE
jgi:hypothetical protein